ncbi:trehalose-phosphatase [Rhabdothermincola salaria]|uniref:trehalose-phosphatase n=1 Tax=Rhabdothermincola salaria TaxID=2903142 RepID=UPI001E2B1B36|nr:trehalose-phosphatase [Rhabdothermincola salaria]
MATDPAEALLAFDGVLAAPHRAGVFTDFDGTLAAIVADPDTSRPLHGSVEVLDRLAGVVARVAVISGRPVAFLERFFPSSVTVSGLYGLQRVVGGTRDDHPEAAAWAPVVDEVVTAARDGGPDGMRVEHKELSVTLHYREHPELAGEVEAWAAAEAVRTGLEKNSARMSVELHPPVPADKGTALLDLADGLAAVCFLGDDVGDLPAFAALDVLAERGVATVKVAVSSDEQDQRLADTADVHVDGPEGALELLGALADRLT